MESVSRADAVLFCRKLSELPEEKRHGRVYRLPTEEEWEYACRGGHLFKESAPFYFKEPVFALDAVRANFDGRYPYGGATAGINRQRPEPVGSHEANVAGSPRHARQRRGVVRQTGVTRRLVEQHRQRLPGSLSQPVRVEGRQQLHHRLPRCVFDHQALAGREACQNRLSGEARRGRMTGEGDGNLQRLRCRPSFYPHWACFPMRQDVSVAFGVRWSPPKGATLRSGSLFMVLSLYRRGASGEGRAVRPVAAAPLPGEVVGS